MKKLTLALNPRERALLMKYAYPFDGISEQCRALETSSDVEPIVDDSYWWEQIAGNLAITLNKEVAPGPLADELHELADRVEALIE